MEEYENQAGELKTVNKLREFRSIGKIDNVKIPKVKLLDGTYVDYEEYTKSSADKAKDLFGSSVEVSSDELPF